MNESVLKARVQEAFVEDKVISWHETTLRPEEEAQLKKAISTLVLIPSRGDIQRLQEKGVVVYQPEKQEGKYTATMTYINPERTLKIEYPTIGVEVPGVNIINWSSILEEVRGPGKIIAFRIGPSGEANFKYPILERLSIVGAEKFTHDPIRFKYKEMIFGNVSEDDRYLARESQQFYPLTVNGEYNRDLTFIRSFIKDKQGRGEGIALHFADGSMILFSSAPRADFVDPGIGSMSTLN